MEFVNACLNLPNLGFALLDEGLLEREFLRRQLRLEDLRLTLRGCRTFYPSLFLSMNNSRIQSAQCAHRVCANLRGLASEDVMTSGDTTQRRAMATSSPNPANFMKEKCRDSRGAVSLVLYRMLNTLDDCALPFRADLLRTLARDEGQLEIMRRLLQRRLVSRLEGPISIPPAQPIQQEQPTHQHSLHSRELLQVI